MILLLAYREAKVIEISICAGLGFTTFVILIVLELFGERSSSCSSENAKTCPDASLVLGAVHCQIMCGGQ